MYKIVVVNPERLNKGVKAVIQDGRELEDKKISLVNDGKEHEVKVVIGRDGFELD